MKSLIHILAILMLGMSCSQSDDENFITLQESNGIHVFEKEFISNVYRKNTSDSLKINISTIVEVALDDDDNYPNGLYLVMHQNFRYRNSFGFFDPGTLTDTLFISNHTNRQFALNGDIAYINASYYIEEPEVVVHDRNFTFYRP